MSPSSPESFPEFLKRLAALVETNPDAVRAELAEVEKASEDDELYAFICGELYAEHKDKMLKRGPYTYPCLIYPASDEQDDVDSVLGAWATEAREGVGIREQTLIQKHYWNVIDNLWPYRNLEAAHPKFAASKIYTENELKVDCYGASYESVMSTCDILELELVHAWMSNSDKLRSKRLASLPLRREIHKMNKGNTLGTAGIVLGLASSTLICCKTKKRIEMSLFRRSQGVSVRRGKYHVAPSGMLERHAHNDEIDYSVKENILKKLAEERLAEKSAEIVHYKPGWHTRIESIECLGDNIEEGKASLRLIGFVQDLINLRVDVIALLYIGDDNWDAKYGGGLDLSEKFGSEGMTTSLSVMDNELTQKYAQYLKPSAIVPVGAAAFWLGRDIARKLVEGVMNVNEWRDGVLGDTREMTPSELKSLDKKLYSIIIDERRGSKYELGYIGLPCGTELSIEKRMWMLLLWALLVRSDNGAISEGCLREVFSWTEVASLNYWDRQASDLRRALSWDNEMLIKRGGVFEIHSKVAILWVRPQASLLESNLRLSLQSKMKKSR